MPVLLYNYLGFDVPSAAAGEMRDPQRDLPAGILRAGVWTLVLYAVPVLATLLVIPADRITGLTGFVSAIREVFTVYGPAGGALGAGAGLLLIWVLVTSGATWLMASARSQAVACLDGAGPRRLGVFSAQGTPARLAVVSGVVASVVSLATFSIAGSSAERYFAVALSLSIAVIALSYVAIFAAPLRLRHTHPSSSAPSACPADVGLWVCSGLSLAWTVGALALLLWPPHLPEAFREDRATFQLTQIVPLALLIVCGLVFASAGRRSASSASPGGEVLRSALLAHEVRVLDRRPRRPCERQLRLDGDHVARSSGMSRPAARGTAAR